jgi:crotonobetainyl-CoA:carnitine CoA-transferase CaiB-like acyl-CoA transferase
MGSVTRLGELLGCPPLLAYTDPALLFSRRDEIKAILVEHLKTQTTEHWLEILEAHDVWCADVLTWQQLFEHEAFKVLNMTQTVSRGQGIAMETTRCPIRIDGELFTSAKGAPRLGEDNEALMREFLLGRS